MNPSHASLHEYWNSFYNGPGGTSIAKDASPFARWLQPKLSPGQPVAELGFGTGRDSLWFARRGHPVMAFDFAETAVSGATNTAKSEGLDQATFKTLDLYDSEMTNDAVAEIRRITVGPALYGRFLLHSLEPQGRSNVINMASKILSDGGLLALEFRIGEDSNTKHVFGEDHFRVYLDPQEVVDEIKQKGGTVADLQTGQGMAKYKNEDPHVARILARW